MQITYYALKDVSVGGELRHEGDLVPEAMYWRKTQLYVDNGTIAPVLTITLPKPMRDQLDEWETEQNLMQELVDEAAKTISTEESR